MFSKICKLSNNVLLFVYLLSISLDNCVCLQRKRVNTFSCSFVLMCRPTPGSSFFCAEFCIMLWGTADSKMTEWPFAVPSSACLVKRLEK